MANRNGDNRNWPESKIKQSKWNVDAKKDYQSLHEVVDDIISSWANEGSKREDMIWHEHKQERVQLQKDETKKWQDTGQRKLSPVINAQSEKQNRTKQIVTPSWSRYTTTETRQPRVCMKITNMHSSQIMKINMKLN